MSPGRSQRWKLSRLAREAVSDHGRDLTLAIEAFRVGRYQIEFGIGAYFLTCGVGLDDPAFLDVVTIRFGIADPEGTLPCSARRLALELLHLSRELTGVSSPRSLSPRSRRLRPRAPAADWRGRREPPFSL